MKRPPIATLRSSLLLIAFSTAASLGAQPEGSAAAPSQNASTLNASTQTSCVICHSDPEIVEPVSIDIAHQFEADAHANAGLSCHDCHGGNPDPALADDMVAAMDESFAEHPFVGLPERTQSPAFCARCHADPAYMRRFNPDLRTDQLAEYVTSHHGMALAKGDQRVATCIDCHGAHGILNAEDPRSKVHPVRVAETCSSCHSDHQRMGTTLADARPRANDEFALWKTSVHAQALLEHGDLSAPTCNDCHGNHGAAPPGQDSLAFVCGQCHGREAELFRASNKRALFEEHNEYLAEADGEGCAACHEPGEPQLELVDFGGFSECSTCHGHHAVVRPSVALLSPLPTTPCAFCHEAPPGAPEEWEPAASRDGYVARRDELLTAVPADMDDNQQFDWLVDRALELDSHTRPAAEGQAAPTLEPEFARLFEKFRIGKTLLTIDNPLTGQTEQRPIRTCGACHAPEPALGEPAGANMSVGFLERLWQLSATTARAERVLLSAQRGGVETSAVESKVDQAIDAQIELVALVHRFELADEGAFATKQAEGLVVAQSALAAGREALGELASRRKGLLIALAFIALFLVALGLKIREIDARG